MTFWGFVAFFLAVIVVHDAVHFIGGTWARVRIREAEARRRLVKPKPEALRAVSGDEPSSLQV